MSLSHLLKLTTSKPLALTLILGLVLGIEVSLAKETSHNKPNNTTKEPLLAVIDINNNTGKMQPFIAGFPDMLITELMESESMRLVERTRIKTAMKALKIETSGLTEQGNLELGKWLGVSHIIVGTFNEIGNKFRLDLRVIEVSTGKISHAVSSAREHAELLLLVSDVGKELRNKLGPNTGRTTKTNQSQPDTWTPLPKFGLLNIEYKMIVGIFAEVGIPFQRVKVYLNDSLIHISPIIDDINRYFTVFQGKIQEGPHTLVLKHGIVDERGNWIRELDESPKPITLDIREGNKPTVRYKMRAEDRWNTFSKLTVKW